MPRHVDPRLRLTRVSHGYELLPPGAAITSPAANSCRCGLPWCSWTPAREREAARGYKRRRGVWRSANGRFTLEWVSSSSGGSKRRPDGNLRMFDRELLMESWHQSMKAARAVMIERYERRGAQ